MRGGKAEVKAVWLLPVLSLLFKQLKPSGDVTGTPLESALHAGAGIGEQDYSFSLILNHLKLLFHKYTPYLLPYVLAIYII